MKTRYKNVTVDPDRHGKLRARFRKAGRHPTYMKTLPDQPGFEAELKALREDDTTDAEKRHAPGSINALLTRYYKSAAFRGQGASEDRARRRGILELFREEYGNDQVSDFTFEHIEAILIAKTEKRTVAKGRVVGGEVAAHNLRKQLNRMFAYAKKLQWCPTNPVEDAERVGKQRLAGFYSWSEDDIAAYKRRHPLGTRARLALEIILWTGQRRGDTLLFGPKHIVRGKINFRAGKNDADLWLPMAPDLRAAIDAMPSIGLATFLVTEFGKTFTKDGFGNKMREWCDQAGLPHCTAHGLRKALATRAAQTRSTQQMLKAVGGWKGDEEVSTYVASVEQEGLADTAIQQVIDRFSDT